MMPVNANAGRGGNARPMFKSVVAVMAALGAVAAVFAAGRYADDIDRARRRVAAGSEIARTPCGVIEYAVAGSGPPVLMVHGSGGGFDQGLAFARPLVAAGFRVIAMSRFGYLRTPLPDDASPAAQADAHACLLDAIGVERVAAIGGSAGAPSTMQFCLRYPQRCGKMVLIVPLAYAPGREGGAEEPSALLQFVFEHVLGSDAAMWAAVNVAPRLLIRTILATPIENFDAASPVERRRARAILGQILPVSRRVQGLRNDAAIAMALPRYELERLAAPTLILSVEDDLYGTWQSGRYSAAHIPGARFVGYPSGGHIWLGHDADLAAEMIRFLAEPARR